MTFGGLASKILPKKTLFWQGGAVQMPKLEDVPKQCRKSTKIYKPKSNSASKPLTS